jgi:hypothetical protein
MVAMMYEWSKVWEIDQMLYRGDRYIGYNVLRVHRKNFHEGYSAVHRL